MLTTSVKKALTLNITGARGMEATRSEGNVT